MGPDTPISPTSPADTLYSDEKGQPFAIQSGLEERIGANEGYVLDAGRHGSDIGDLKTTEDGKTVLIPQPTDSPDDPLNWSTRKKHTILFLISAIAFLPDFGSSMGAVTLIPQSKYWDLPEAIVQHNLVGNLFCLGAGGLFTVALSHYFGRLPVLFYFQILAFVTSIWCAVAVSFESFLAARIVNGFFAIVAQAGGLMWIKDIFFFHEHPRKINIWSGGVILSPYLGPLTAAFITWRTTWRWAYWVYTMLNGVGIILIVLLGEESYFARDAPPNKRRSWNSRLLRLVGFEKHTTASALTAVARPAIAISKIPVLMVVIYYFLNFAWIIGVNATISTWLTEFYGFKPWNLGLFYFAPIVGSILGELVGHFLHDAVGSFYARRRGRIDAEVRLILCYLASVLMGVGVLVLGFALQHRWHYMAVAVFAAMQVVGIMIATTAVNAYLLDSYPEGSGEVCAWINVGRTMGGFMATYIEIPWIQEHGTAAPLGIQAGITFAASVIPIFLQVFGKRIRQWQGEMKFPS
ncbi:MFS general substrate transporter [Polychaeton citri CBS 116435]|uniref:MFS general substrate transporter n=1 Tax=Polychaeton citri CBS 116435 TaxID=1314669 RepID=A0A9P4UMZ1_9PEZI|nr:MFS general substrate transporter [Polychaeton citri CBS 116435]